MTSAEQSVLSTQLFLKSRGRDFNAGSHVNASHGSRPRDPYKRGALSLVMAEHAEWQAWSSFESIGIPPLRQAQGRDFRTTLNAEC